MNKQYRIKEVLKNGYYDGYGYYKGVLYAESYASLEEAEYVISQMKTIPKFGVIIEPFYTK